jgi:hypothetical protein
MVVPPGLRVRMLRCSVVMVPVGVRVVRSLLRNVVMLSLSGAVGLAVRMWGFGRGGVVVVFGPVVAGMLVLGLVVLTVLELLLLLAGGAIS